MLDMNISQFLKSLGLEHLRDIFEREQVSDLKNTSYIHSYNTKNFTALFNVCHLVSPSCLDIC